MGSILVLGAFGYQRGQLDGQTIKTRMVREMLRQRAEGRTVRHFDTLEVRRNPLLLLRLLLRLLTCRVLVIMPAHRSLTYILPLAYWLSRVARYRLLLICIGGWQVDYFLGSETLRPHPYQLAVARRVDAIFAEQKATARRLREELHFQNVAYLPNFRKASPTPPPTPSDPSQPLRLVYLGRINQQKGIGLIFRLVEYLRSRSIPVMVGIYGQVASEYHAEFQSLVDTHADVSYHGALQPSEIPVALAGYDVMLFPTRYYTEGLPGTIIDAYLAHLPVIATAWLHAQEFIDDGRTGLIIPFEEPQAELNARVEYLHEHRNLLHTMRLAAGEEGEKYSEDAAWRIIQPFLVRGKMHQAP